MPIPSVKSMFCRGGGSVFFKTSCQHPSVLGLWGSPYRMLSCHHEDIVRILLGHTREFLGCRIDQCEGGLICKLSGSGGKVEPLLD